MAKKQEKCEQSSALAALQKASKGLRYTSETDAPLEAFDWQDSARLTQKHLLDLAGAETGSTVEQQSLEDFFYAVPPEDKSKFDQLARVLQEQLSGIKVYKIGDEAEKEAFIVGKTREGHWAGLKTTVVET